MKIYFASDHAGFELKGKLIPFVEKLGHEIRDLGPGKFDAEDDYPIFIEKVGMEIFKDPENSRAIILGASGQGEAIVANRFPNVRAVVFYGYDTKILKLSREHNDANILSLGVKFISKKEAEEAIKLWLETPFSGDKRHLRRLKEIDKLEESLYINP